MIDQDLAHGKDGGLLDHHDHDPGLVHPSSFKGSPVDVGAGVLSRSLSQGSLEDLGAVVPERLLLQGRQSGLAAPVQSSSTEMKDAAALDSCLEFLAAVAALLHASSRLEVVVPALALLDVYSEGDGPEPPRQSSLTQTGLALIHLPAAIVAAASVHLPQSSLLAAVVQDPIPLGDLSGARDPLYGFSRAMAVDVTVRVPDHRAEGVHIHHLEDMRVLGTIRLNMTEALGDIVAIALPLDGAVLRPDAVALCSEACLGVVPHVEALGWIPLIMTVAAAVVRPEKVPGMAQKNMTEVPHAVAPLGKALDTIQKSMKEEHVMVLLEVALGMVQKSMIGAVETRLVGDYVHVRDPLDKTQRSLTLDRRVQDHTIQKSMKEEHVMVLLEVALGMVQKSMIEAVETRLVGDYVHVQDPLDKTQRSLTLDRRAQDDQNLLVD
jgi:hypothetical protein